MNVYQGTNSMRLVLLLLLVTSIGHAQIIDSPRGMAMSAVRGDPVGSSAVISNPAGMSRSYLYTAEMVYVRGAPGDLNVTGLNIVDSKTQPTMAVGVSYGFHFTDEKALISQKGHDGRVAFAHPAIPEKLNLGVSLRYLQIERKQGAEDLDKLEGFTIDVGLLFSATPQFHIGVVGHNLVNLKDPSVPRRVGGGVAYTGKEITLDVDLVMDLDQHPDGPKPITAVGIEALLGGSVPLRGGFTHDAVTDNKWVSGGLGFVTGEGKNGGQLSLSYRHNLDEADSYAFALGLTVFL
jgi:hypothetical protein